MRSTLLLWTVVFSAILQVPGAEADIVAVAGVAVKGGHRVPGVQLGLYASVTSPAFTSHTTGENGVFALVFEGFDPTAGRLALVYRGLSYQADVVWVQPERVGSDIYVVRCDDFVLRDRIASASLATTIGEASSALDGLIDTLAFRVKAGELDSAVFAAETAKEVSGIRARFNGSERAELLGVEERLMKLGLFDEHEVARIFQGQPASFEQLALGDFGLGVGGGSHNARRESGKIFVNTEDLRVWMEFWGDGEQVAELELYGPTNRLVASGATAGKAGELVEFKPRTEDYPAGEYRAVLYLGGEKVRDERFTISADVIRESEETFVPSVSP